MDNSLENLPRVTLMPFHQAILVAIALGALIGTAIAVREVLEYIITSKLNISQQGGIKTLVVSLLVSFTILAIFILAIHLFSPARAARIDQVNSAIASLGYVTFFLLTLAVMLVTALPGSFIKNKLRSAVSSS